MKALLVHSPKAGTDPEPLGPLIAQLAEAGFETIYCEHGVDDIAAGMVHMDIAIAAGGDGTVTSVVTEIPDRSTPIAILPMGGSNNIARSLGIHTSVGETIRGLARPSQKALTIGSVSRPFGKKKFVEAVGVGALNEAIEKVDEAPDTSEEKRENGRIAFRETRV